MEKNMENEMETGIIWKFEETVVWNPLGSGAWVLRIRFPSISCCLLYGYEDPKP